MAIATYLKCSHDLALLSNTPFLDCLNATEAAERACYSKKTANQQGTRLLAKVGLILAPLLRVQQEELAKEGGVSLTKWLKEIERTHVGRSGEQDSVTTEFKGSHPAPSPKQRMP